MMRFERSRTICSLAILCLALFIFGCDSGFERAGNGYTGAPVFPVLDGDTDGGADGDSNLPDGDDGDTVDGDESDGDATDGDVVSDACDPNPCTDENKTVCSVDGGGDAVCNCDDGYTDYGDGACLPSDPCADDTDCASANRVCENNQGTAECGDCLGGYHDEEGSCVEDTGCTDTTCSGNGACDDTGGTPVCDCDDAWSGDHCETCIVPADWPPPSPWWNERVCNLPACDDAAAICIDLSGMWRRTLKTLTTNCNSSLGGIDPRVNIGNEEITEYELGVVGQCDDKEDAPGVMRGVVKGNVEIICDVNPQALNSTSVETAIITYNEVDGALIGTGSASVFIYDVPVFGNCGIEFSILMERLP